MTKPTVVRGAAGDHFLLHYQGYEAAWREGTRARVRDPYGYEVDSIRLEPGFTSKDFTETVETHRRELYELGRLLGL